MSEPSAGGDTLLGAIIAGGRASRFGGDKGAALLNGVALIDHVAGVLRPACAEVVIVGRQWAALRHIADVPAPGLGPLGGLCGALLAARVAGHGHVLTAGCDSWPLPDNLAALLGWGEPLPEHEARVIDRHWLIGLWPVSLADQLVAHLHADNDRSIYGWIAACGARKIAVDFPWGNINTPDDLERAAAKQG